MKASPHGFSMPKNRMKHASRKSVAPIRILARKSYLGTPLIHNLWDLKNVMYYWGLCTKRKSAGLGCVPEFFAFFNSSECFLLP